MEAISVSEILKAVNGKILGDFSDLEMTLTHVETDSRSITEGSLFIPLVGERFDGHAFINQALEAGAAACFTACPISSPSSI